MWNSVRRARAAGVCCLHRVGVKQSYRLFTMIARRCTEYSFTTVRELL